MQERERIVVTGLVVLMLVTWLGFAVHRASTFAASAAGLLFGVAAAALLLIPLAYSIVKRIAPLRAAITRRVPLRTLLAWHIYAGVLGPVLGIIHTGHKFDSPLGIALTASMLVVALSGFVGRYLLTQVSTELTEKQKSLDGLRAEYAKVTQELAQHPELRPTLGLFGGTIRRLVGAVLTRDTDADTRLAPARVLRLTDAIADLEYAVKTHEAFKRWFARWLSLHIILSFALYGLLALHVTAGIGFGLRWWS